MLELLRHVFENDFMPHGHCYFWEKDILIPIVIGDLLTFLSYMAIPILLWKFVKNREDLRFGVVFKAFAAFIFFCGIGHLIDVVNIWEPYYRVSAIAKMCTGLVSLGTIIMLFKLYPKALKLPSVARLDSLNEELKRKNRELTELNEMYDDTMKAVRLGYWHLEIETNELHWSDVVYDIHEMERGCNVDVASALNFYHPDHREVISELVTNAIQNSEPFDVQLKIITASQNELWVRAIGKAELKNGKPVKLKGLFQDIDDLKRKEEQLTQNESALKEAEDLAQLGNWRWSFDRQERYWSDGRFKILGYEPGEIEPSLQVALDSVHPEDRERVEGTIKKAIEKDEDYELSYRIINQSNEVRIVKDKGVFVNLPHTKGQYYAGIVMDITDESLKEQKLQESLKALERSNRELQDFAYVASHDLQEPLRVITSYLQLIEMSYGHLLDDEGKLFIESIIKASARMKTLINDLLVLSRLETKQRDAVPVDLNKVINVVKEDLSLKIIDSNAEIKHPELPVVYGDEGRMRRLFQNFIGNSIKFRRPDVDPKIEIEWSDVGEKYQFKIKDNGIGIKEECFERIFTIFQRLHTREEYEGTGIGLAICKKIVDKHDSTIRVESEYGKGSSFIFELNKSKG